MGNFEKLSVLVIVVIIVMILVVALYTWTDKPEDSATTQADLQSSSSEPRGAFEQVPPMPDMDGGDGWSQPPSITDEPPTLDEPDAPEPVSEPPALDEPILADEPENEESTGPWYYTIKKGDVLSIISQRELGTARRVKDILALNPGLNPLALQPGDRIKMPPRGSASSARAAGPGATPSQERAIAGTPRPGNHYVIQKGDIISSISKQAYGTIERWPEIWASNLGAIPDPDNLMAGRKIFLPK